MKKLLLSLALIAGILGLHAGNGYELNYSEPQPGVMQLTFDLSQFDLIQVNLNSVGYTKIDFEGQLHLEKKGWAELPYLSAAVQLPADKNVDIVFLGGDFEDFQLDDPLVPSRGVIYRDQDPSTIPYWINPASITGKFYPGLKAENTAPYIIKDVRGTTILVYPFQYNAAENTLRVYQNITIQLVENNSAAVNPLSVSSGVPLREMVGIYESIFVNYKPSDDDLTIGDFGDILVICTDRDEDAIEPYIVWKKEKGFNVFKEVVATGTDITDLVQEQYDANNNILYVLLVGDWADVKVNAPGGTPKDPVVGCVSGPDDYMDICIGRFSANSAVDVTTQVNKIINYEKYPEMGATWYEAATGIASNQGPGDDNEKDYEHLDVIWNNKLDPFTYETYTPIYDPGANATMVTNALEAGTGIINYTGHGSSTSWGTSGFSNNHIAALNNGNKLPFIFSVACSNGTYHNGTCFAEAWMRKEGGGAITAVMATIGQPWDPPMRGQDYFNDVLTGGYDYSLYPGQNGISTFEGRTTIGSVVFNGLVLMITEAPTTDLLTAQTWITFGDPSMQIRTATPANLSYSNNVLLVGAPFETTVTANGAPIEGAIVALTQNDVTYSAITNVTGFVSIPNDFLPGDITIVITGFNTETIYETIQCIPPTGPYVIFNNVEINDVNGNNNGILEYFDGNVLLNFSVKNVGVETANNVTVSISSSDPYITITDGTEFFGNIAAGEILTIDNAFAFDIAGDVPEGHGISFDVTAVGEETWESAFCLVAYSALLEYENYTIDDSMGNNNGILDPGETADLIVTIANNGSAKAFNVMGTLESLDPVVIVNTTTVQSFGDIAGTQTSTASFSVTAGPTIPGGYIADVELNFTADYGFAGSTVIGILFPDYCYGEASCSWGDGFTDFALEEISNMNNGCSNDNGLTGYGDFTDMIANLDPGATYTVTWGTGYSNQYACLWIDFDDDKEFEESERLITDFILSTSGQIYTTDFTIPDDVPTGIKRMRIRAKWQYSSADPCENFSYGETEDYTAVIGQGAFLPPPTNVTANVTGNNVTINWTAPEVDLLLLGYNMYRDGEVIAAMIVETSYTDENCSPGSYWYSVSAIYSEGESGIADPVQVDISGVNGKLQGFVRDAVTKYEIPNAVITASNTDFGAVTYSTPFGSHYTLYLPGGTYDILCTAEGYQPKTEYGVVIAEGGVKHLTFYLLPSDDERLLTGTDENASNLVMIYPNPASDNVTIIAENIRELQIFNHTGQLIHSDNQIEGQLLLNTSAYRAGVYFIKIVTDSGILNEKLIIKK